MSVSSGVTLALEEDTNMPGIKSPDCNICMKKFAKLELFNNHMRIVHKESDNDRTNRLTATIKENQLVKIVCELCEKVFPNRVEKSNHKLFVHTVRAEILQCDYCIEKFDGLKRLCKHIGNSHSELFPKRRGNQCYICSKIFGSIEETTNHMDESHSPDSFYEKIVEDMSAIKYEKKNIKTEYKEEEAKILDLVNNDSNLQTKKKANYTLNEEKTLLNMKSNIERGNIRVEDTPKGGAKLVYLNPGEFKEVMEVLVDLKVNQRFTIGNINIHVIEKYVMEENKMKKVQHKLALRLNKRTFPTATTSPTLHIYPTDQKIMIQGSRQAQLMGEKEFILPFIEKVLNGKEAKVSMINKAVSEVRLISKKRKTRQSLPCKYCELPFNSISEMKRHVVSSHIVALEALPQISKESDTISPSSSPPPKKEKHSSNMYDTKKVFTCEDCANTFQNINDLRDHVKKHKVLKPNIQVKAAGKEIDDNLMVHDAGIEVEDKNIGTEKDISLAPSFSLHEGGVVVADTSEPPEAEAQVSKEPPGAERCEEKELGAGLKGSELVQLASWLQGCKVAPSVRPQESRVEGDTSQAPGVAGKDSKDPPGLQRSEMTGHSAEAPGTGIQQGREDPGAGLQRSEMAGQQGSEVRSSSRPSGAGLQEGREAPGAGVPDGTVVGNSSEAFGERPNTMPRAGLQKDEERTNYFLVPDLNLPEDKGATKYNNTDNPDNERKDLLIFKEMYEQEKQERLKLNIYIVKLEKALEACNTETTERLLEANVGLKKNSEELGRKVAQQQEEISILHETVTELAEGMRSKTVVTPNIESAAVTEPVEGNSTETVVAPIIENVNENVAALNDIETLVRLKESGYEREGPQADARQKSVQKVSVNNDKFKCQICHLIRDTKIKLERHMQNHIDDGDWTCDDCAYQSNDQNALLNHMLEKHHSSVLLDFLLNKNIYDKKFKCNFCKKQFPNKNDLINHKKIMHKTYQPCRSPNNCSWGEECLFNHEELGENMFICYQCGEKFDSRHKVMIHRRIVHKNEICRAYLKGSCEFSPCWFSHVSISKNTSSPEIIDTNNQPLAAQLSGFWETQQKRAPPLQSQQQQPQQQQPNQQQQQQQQTLIIYQLQQQMNQQLKIMQQLMNSMGMISQ